MTAARRLLILLCVAAAAVGLWFAWSTMKVGAEPLEPTLCPVGSVDPACAQPVVNRPPDAVDDELRSRPGRTMRTNVLGNDSDPDGDALLTGTGTVTTAAGGQVTFYGDGLFSYRTPAGFVGVDRFEYGLSDSYGAPDVGEVTIRVG